MRHFYALITPFRDTNHVKGAIPCSFDSQSLRRSAEWHLPRAAGTLGFKPVYKKELNNTQIEQAKERFFNQFIDFRRYLFSDIILALEFNKKCGELLVPKIREEHELKHPELREYRIFKHSSHWCKKCKEYTPRQIEYDEHGFHVVPKCNHRRLIMKKVRKKEKK